MNPYAIGFDKSEVERLPGCAFWTDSFGTILLGYTKEGASLEVDPGLEEEVADESGNTPLQFVHVGDKCRLKLIMLETTLARMERVLPTSDLSGGELRFGVTPGTVAATGKIVHRPFAYGDGSHDLVVDQAVNIGKQVFSQKTKEVMTINCEFEAVLQENNASGNLTGAGIGQD